MDRLLPNVEPEQDVPVKMALALAWMRSWLQRDEGCVLCFCDPHRFAD